jgi:hypothetical protein
VSPHFHSFISIHLTNTYWMSTARHYGRSWQDSVPIFIELWVHRGNKGKESSLIIQCSSGRHRRCWGGDAFPLTVN